MRIGGVELSPADVSWLEREGRKPKCTRTSLARAVCERLGLTNALGKVRIIAARIDLCRHAIAKRLSLPSAKQFGTRNRSTSALVQPAFRPAPRAQVEQSEVASLTVQLVNGPSDRFHEAWKRSLNDHHYLGAGPLCGEQLRYVVRAGERVVATASFSAAARHVEARDTFIGWSAVALRRNRHLLIMQSRFCVTVKAKNLATRVQAMLLRRVADDWQKSYGHRPVLAESYVDTSRFKGTCYKASNWELVGETKGRGRQDVDHKAGTSIKTVWMYPLDPSWRETLCAEPPRTIRAIGKDLDWAETEWGRAELGDRRLVRRLVSYGRARFMRPNASLPQACGSRAATKAAYRLLNHDSASLDSFLSGHREATLARAAESSVVLAIQDTTSLNYSTHLSAEGLGPIGSSGADKTLGLEVHSLMLATPSGVPLGLLDVNAWARDPKKYGKRRKRSRKLTEEKESQKWIRGYQVADAAAKRLGDTDVVVMGDREADMFDLFKVAAAGQADLLVRAVHPRRVLNEDGGVEGTIWDLVRNEPVAGEITVAIPRNGSRPPRQARVTLRYRAVNVSRPHSKSGKPHSIKIWAIAATESKSEARPYAPLSWLLLTTLKVESPKAAVEKVDWYSKRWMIEVYHRTLKSGCRIEDRQSMRASSLKAALAVDAVVAWRVMSLTKLSREIPEVPCTHFFNDWEWKGLYGFCHHTNVLPAKPPSLREMTRLVGSLGGFLGRKGDGEPGTQSLWTGIERLADISGTYRAFFSSA